MALSPKTKNDILRTMTGKAQQINIASTCYIGLLTAEPVVEYDEEVFYSEPTGEGYKRMCIGHYQGGTAVQAMGDPVNGVISNARTVFMDEALASWGTVTHFALFNTETGGTPFLWGALTEPVNIEAERVPIFRAGRLIIRIE